jgi:hypothetical protein
MAFCGRELETCAAKHRDPKISDELWGSPPFSENTYLHYYFSACVVHGNSGACVTGRKRANDCCFSYRQLNFTR